MKTKKIYTVARYTDTDYDAEPEWKQYRHRSTKLERLIKPSINYGLTRENIQTIKEYTK